MTEMKTIYTIFALLLLPGYILGDDGVFRGVGGAVVPWNAEHVRMAAEEVVLDLADPQVVHGTCFFVMVNDGPADTLLIGFPENSPAVWSREGMITQPSLLTELTITDDGERVTTREMPVADLPGDPPAASRARLGYDRAHVWTCAFAPGETRVLRTEYRHPVSATVANPVVLHYVLTTGASWAGTIGKVVVRVQPGDLRLKGNDYDYPRDWIWTGQEYVWVVENLEPDRNLRIGLGDPDAIARQLADRWYDLLAKGRDPQSIATGKLLSLPGSLGDVDFFGQIRAALGDSLPELSAILDTVFTEHGTAKH